MRDAISDDRRVGAVVDRERDERAKADLQPPVYDVTRVGLDGSLRANEASDRVEVVTGSFSIATSPASFGFTANAGQCVTSTDTVEPTTGALFTQWTVGSCK